MATHDSSALCVSVVVASESGGATPASADRCAVRGRRRSRSWRSRSASSLVRRACSSPCDHPPVSESCQKRAYGHTTGFGTARGVFVPSSRSARSLTPRRCATIVRHSIARRHPAQSRVVTHRSRRLAPRREHPERGPQQRFDAVAVVDAHVDTRLLDRTPRLPLVPGRGLRPSVPSTRFARSLRSAIRSSSACTRRQSEIFPLIFPSLLLPLYHEVFRRSEPCTAARSRRRSRFESLCLRERDTRRDKPPTSAIASTIGVRRPAAPQIASNTFDDRASIFRDPLGARLRVTHVGAAPTSATYSANVGKPSWEIPSYQHKDQSNGFRCDPDPWEWHRKIGRSEDLGMERTR